MHILITGANGFIGSHLTAQLLRSGHNVTAAVRAPDKLKRRFPTIQTTFADLNHFTKPADWQPLLRNIDVVINCAGLLQTRHGQKLCSVHALGPIDLFDACVLAKTKKIIQISAIGVEGTSDFARTKRQADDYLETLKIDWTILRPSLVYGRDSYGGTAMLRALAASPFFIPLIGKGDQKFQPIHINDLCLSVLLAIKTKKLAKKIISPCGPDIMTVHEITRQWRAWLGLAPAKFIQMPKGLITAAARLGDIFGKGPLTTTALQQINHSPLADFKAFSSKTGLTPKSFQSMLASEPANADALWHARLYAARPLVHITLIIIWLWSGLMGLLLPSEQFQHIFSALPDLPPHIGLLAKLTGLADLAIALGLLIRWRYKTMFWIQMLMVLGYSCALTVLSPGLWLDPLGPLLKNLPILILIIIHRVLEEER